MFVSVDFRTAFYTRNFGLLAAVIH